MARCTFLRWSCYKFYSIFFTLTSSSIFFFFPFCRWRSCYRDELYFLPFIILQVLFDIFTLKRTAEGHKRDWRGSEGRGQTDRGIEERKGREEERKKGPLQFFSFIIVFIIFFIRRNIIVFIQFSSLFFSSRCPLYLYYLSFLSHV